MKLPTSTITQFARDVFSKKKRTTAKKLINPKRDWLIGIMIGAGILLGIMAWSAYMYVSNRSGTVTQTEQDPVAVPVYRAQAVSQAVDIFAEKQTRFAALQNQAVPVLAPEEPREEQTAGATTTIPVVSVATSTPTTTPAQENTQSLDTPDQLESQPELVTPAEPKEIPTLSQ